MSIYNERKLRNQREVVPLTCNNEDEDLSNDLLSSYKRYRTKKYNETALLLSLLALSLLTNCLLGFLLFTKMSSCFHNRVTTKYGMASDIMQRRFAKTRGNSWTHARFPNCIQLFLIIRTRSLWREGEKPTLGKLGHQRRRDSSEYGFCEEQGATAIHSVLLGS